MIGWEVLEHLGYRGRVDRLKLGALDEVSIRRAFAAMAKEPDSGERDYAAYLEALCRQYEDYHLGLNGTRAIYDVSGQGLPYERFVIEREGDRWFIAE